MKIPKRKNQISNYPSEAIRQVVADMQEIEKTPGWKIDMWEWYAKDFKGLCTVCMGGAYLLKEPGVRDSDWQGGFGFSQIDFLRAESFEDLRRGLLMDFLHTWIDDQEYYEYFKEGHKMQTKIREMERNWHHYEASKPLFYRQCLEFAKYLEDMGY